VWRSISNFNALNRWIDESNRSDEDKFFLKLLLISLLPDGSTSVSEEQNRKDARRFGQLYPESRYNSFVRKYVAAEYGLSDFGATLGVGGGYPLFSNANLDLKWSIIISYGFIYKRWHLDGWIQGSFGKFAQDILFERWVEGEKVELTNIGFSLGYSVFDSKRWRVTPFGGFSYNLISTGKIEEASHTIKAYCPALGMDFDLKLNPWHSLKNNTSTVAYAKLRINYLPATFNNAGKMWEGSMVLATMSVAFDFHFPKRIF